MREIQPGIVLTLGRSTKNRIVLSDPSISSFHATLRKQVDGNWTVEDLGSKNGTYLDDSGQRITQAIVASDDPIRFGKHVTTVSRLLSPKGHSTSPGLINRPSTPEGFTEYSIGRSTANQIHFTSYKQISRQHARLLRSPSGQWFIEDMGSRHGTFVGDRTLPAHGPVPFNKGDVVYLASLKIPARKLISMALRRGATSPEGTALAVSQDRPMVIGRAQDADILLPTPQVSLRHARLTPTGDNQWIIEDLGSKNGTYVNGRRVSRLKITSGDLITLGSHQLRLVPGMRQVLAKDIAGNIRLDAQRLRFEVGPKAQPKILLNDIDFTVYPGEFVGLMGLSGSGKTTLLLTLLGYCRANSGYSRLNGLDLYSNYEQFKNLIGYMPQDDILHGELTVREALFYGARLRLPKDMSRAEIEGRIETVLTELGLIDRNDNLDVRDVILGTATRKGISGGQRKRVNLALELLPDPPVLFLDEPTSGLSSVDTVQVMQYLRKLADQGKTIVLTLHQPDIESYKQLNNVLILHYGKEYYYGPAWPDSLQFFNPDRDREEVLHRPESGLLGLHRGFKSKGDSYWTDRYAKSPIKRLYIDERSADDQQPDPPSKEAGRRVRRGLFSFHQFGVLLRRNLAIKFKDRFNSGMLLAQAPIISLLLGMLFFKMDSLDQLHATPLFLLAVSAIWLGTSNAAREIVSERAIYLRERMLGLGVLEYLLSKFANLSLLCIIQCVTLVLLVKFLVMVRAPTLELVAVTLLTSEVGVALGLAVSTFSKTQAGAQTLIPIVILPMVMLGGGMVTLPEMENNSLVLSMAQTMPSRWAFEAMVTLESPEWSAEEVSKLFPGQVEIPVPSKANATSGENNDDANSSASQTDDGLTLISTVFGDHTLGVQYSVLILLAFIVALLGTTLVGLRLKDPL